MGASINKLGSRINHVGASAAALAALHPQDFDPDSKWDIAAGYGNYKSAHAVAVGAFYRPSEDVLLSAGGSFSGGENMINAGVSLKVGGRSHVTRSKVAMAKELLELKAIVARQDEQIKTLMAGGTRKITNLGDVTFPDVPKNHWAYDCVKRLADLGYVEGYPDGEFKGDRQLSRYEYAAILYRALQNGSPNDASMGRAVEEFKPELIKVQDVERFRVDRVKGEAGDKNKIERIRVNDDGIRDGYGTILKA